MDKLRAFFQENRDIIWPVLCLFFCGLAILFAALRKNETEIAITNNSGKIALVKDNRMGTIMIDGEKA